MNELLKSFDAGIEKKRKLNAPAKHRIQNTYTTGGRTDGLTEIQRWVMVVLQMCEIPDDDWLFLCEL